VLHRLCLLHRLIYRTNMLDDHDLIGELNLIELVDKWCSPLTPADGFGSYDDETQASPVMSRIGSRGYFVSIPVQGADFD
jgi:hypothetical protein